MGSIEKSNIEVQAKAEIKKNPFNELLDQKILFE